MTDDRPTKETFDRLLAELIAQRENTATINTRLQRIEDTPAVMALVEAAEADAKAHELAIAGHDAEAKARAERDRAERASVPAWIKVLVARDQPRGTTRVSIPLGSELGTRDGAPGACIHRERAAAWAERLAADKELAALLASGEIIVEPLTVDEALVAERSARQREAVAASAPRVPINHFANRRSSP